LATQDTIKRTGVSQALLAEIVGRILTCRATRQDHSVRFCRQGRDDEGQRHRLLIIEPTPRNRHEEAVRVRDAIGNIDYPVDVPIRATERFEATRNIIGGIAYPANKYGKVLCAAA
jgi:hypothetical protein